MTLRLVQVVLPSEEEWNAKQLLEEGNTPNYIDAWHVVLSDEETISTVLVATEGVDPIIDLFDERFSEVENYRVILLPVEATLPRPEEQEEEQAEPPADEEAEQQRISREELYEDVTSSIRSLKIYVWLVALSAVVASVGLIQNEITVLIGAVIIAPLLGPNVALALATTLADFTLAKQAFRSAAIGIATALVIAIAVGAVFSPSPEIGIIATRTQITPADIALALASGGAGVLAFTIGLSAALVGVTVAVALLPPLVTLGLMIGGGHWEAALGAALVLVTNIICINLAGVLTFFAQGVTPTAIYESDRAKRVTRIAIGIWVVLLLILAGVLSVARFQLF